MIALSVIAGLLLSASAAMAFSDGGFTDVPDDHYAHDAIDWAHRNGITHGRGDGTFGPGDAITRAEFIAFVHRLASVQQPVQQPDLSIEALANSWLDYEIEGGAGVRSHDGSVELSLQCKTWPDGTHLEAYVFVPGESSARRADSWTWRMGDRHGRVHDPSVSSQSRDEELTAALADNRSPVLTVTAYARHDGFRTTAIGSGRFLIDARPFSLVSDCLNEIGWMPPAADVENPG